MSVAIKIGNNYLSVDEKNLLVYTNNPDYGWKIDGINKLLTYYNQNIIWDNHSYLRIQRNEKQSNCLFEFDEKLNVLCILIPDKKSYLYMSNKSILPTLSDDIDSNCFCVIYDHKSKLGICNWDSVHKFNGEDILKRGVDKIKGLNCNHIKVYIGKKTKNTYNLYDVKDNATLLDLVKHPSYKYVISNFQTIVFVAFSTFKSDDKYWREQFSEQDKKMEYEEMGNFCQYLSKNYPDKQFIIQNWESDWCISDHKQQDYSANMIKWLNVRGEAVRNFSNDNVKYAVEVNHVLKTLYKGEQSALTQLIPYVKVDYISYSAYDSQNNYFEECLKLIKSYCNNVYIGEFGINQLSCTEKQIKDLINNTYNVASRNQCDYIFIWQLYNNEKGKMFGLYTDNDNLTIAGQHYKKLLSQQ